MTQRSTVWWPALYDDLLADVLLDRASPDEAAATIAFLVDHARLEPGMRVFDQCCGTGRLAVPLATWGAEVVGVEQAAPYVERARTAAAAAGVTLRLDVGDAFDYVPEPACDLAINWWTSFGYMLDDDDNVRMACRAFEALVPGGRFALDYPNVPGMCAAFRPHEITRCATPRGELVMLRDSELELDRGLLHKRWTFITPDGARRERTSTLRLYAPDRLAVLIESTGLVEPRIYGGLDGQPLTLASPRCIIVARRPEAS